VKIVGAEKLTQFGKKHATARSPLGNWKQVVEAVEWTNPADMKMTFRTADVVGPQTVFNIGGNKYRLIALVNYRLRIVLVQHVLTHAEYDQEDWKQ
jgi:mRNA interferase HigB